MRLPNLKLHPMTTSGVIKRLLGSVFGFNFAGSLHFRVTSEENKIRFCTGLRPRVLLKIRTAWEDPLEDQEDTGPDADPWGEYGLFDDEEFADCFRGD